MSAPGSFSANFKGILPNKLWQLLFFGLFGLFVTGVSLLALIALVLTPTLPEIGDLTEDRLKVPMRVYTAEGVLIAEFGEEKRIPIKIDQAPPLLIKAILAAEDDSFYYHHGVDFLGIARAAWHNFRSGTASQGASTVTMQVARNFFLSPEKTLTRKLKEVLLAFKIERELSKDEILELYVNKIFLGHRAYGYAAAAQIYYGKSLNELTLPEMAVLAGLPKAPSRDNPLSNPESAKERRNYVLRRMEKLEFIDEPTLAEATETEITASKHKLQYKVEAPYVAEMVRQYMFQAFHEKTYGGGFHVYTTISALHQQAANKALRKGLLEYDRRHGYRGPAGRVRIATGIDRDNIDDVLKGHLDDALKDYREIGNLLPAIVLSVKGQTVTAYNRDGYIVDIEWEGLSWARKYRGVNTLGPSVNKASDILRTGHIIYLEQTDDGNTLLAQLPKVSGAIISIRPTDGAILSLVGGFDFYQSNFNRATQAERQAGSSLKPFIYSAALDDGFTAASMVSGAPIVIEDVNLEDEWRPENYSRQFYGPTRLRNALALSLNLVSVRLLRTIGPTYAIEHMQRFGFDPEKLPLNLSLALGTASLTPIQMTSAYSVFANGGYRVEPYFISRIEDANLNVLERANPTLVCPECELKAPIVDPEEPQEPPPRYAQQVLSPDNAFILTSMMRDVISSGTGRRALALGRTDLSGKTGTTNEYRDAWFGGYNSDLVAVSWVGFDQPESLGRGEAGSRAALPIWIDYMRKALAGVPEKILTPPTTLVEVFINKESGALTDPEDPDGFIEYFVKGTEPSAEQMATDGSTPTAAPTDTVTEGLF